MTATYIGVPKQYNSGNVGVPNKSCGTFSLMLILFLSNTFVWLFRLRNWNPSIGCWKKTKSNFSLFSADYCHCCRSPLPALLLFFFTQFGIFWTLHNYVHLAGVKLQTGIRLLLTFNPRSHLGYDFCKLVDGTHSIMILEKDKTPQLRYRLLLTTLRVSRPRLRTTESLIRCNKALFASELWRVKLGNNFMLFCQNSNQ